MKFGTRALAEAEGCVLAHSIEIGGQRWRKGAVLSGGDIAAMTAAGLNDVIVAQLSGDDLDENAAAARLAQAIVPEPDRAGLRIAEAFTGRVNLIAQNPGVLEIDVGAIEAFNRVHPMITIATLPPWQQMGEGQMAATIKIISYGVPRTAVEQAERLARGALGLRAPVLRDAGLVVTDIPGGPSNDKGIRSTERRLNALGLDLAEVRVVAHDSDVLAEALKEIKGDMALILTGSATSDIADVAPSAVIGAGGHVARFGMPVDPGNLLFLGTLGERPVIGLPGCARSPALNGADWVLSRVVCGVDVSDDDIAGMGVGGLLKEIPTRPQPRAGRKSPRSP